MEFCPLFFVLYGCIECDNLGYRNQIYNNYNNYSTKPVSDYFYGFSFCAKKVLKAF